MDPRPLRVCPDCFVDRRRDSGRGPPWSCSDPVDPEGSEPHQDISMTDPRFRWDLALCQTARRFCPC